MQCWSVMINSFKRSIGRCVKPQAEAMVGQAPALSERERPMTCDIGQILAGLPFFQAFLQATRR